MLPDARIETVKGLRTKALPTVREFEFWLTRDAGLSRSEARAVIAKGFASLVREREAAPGSLQGLVERIREATQIINPKGKAL
jgi:hypothetical protein